MFGTKSLDDEHDCNVVSMNSLNNHDANDMQSHKLGDAMFDEDDTLLIDSIAKEACERENLGGSQALLVVDNNKLNVDEIQVEQM